ncbi:hypothetical protein [Brasilonema sp. UFV-L1]|uniref:hypothetical protein n=1 Tax=Brasilonema sp. UFV-L1 TaxID=2234130 RepID=UPI00145EF92A|nr:hypothetical protein [Brasilonema sp. UFV-L1]NMG09770.1 hypothetical protein [Brasilonema sp. UFV-L1]
MGKIKKGKPQKKFTLISNDLIRDTQVTDSAYRLICWVTSHSDDFEISFSSILSMLEWGKDKLRNAVKNAEINDYLVRTKTRDAETGLFDWDYYIFVDKDEAIAFRKSNPNSYYPSLGNPVSDNPEVDAPSDGLHPPHKNTNAIKQNEENQLKNTQESAAALTELSTDSIEILEEESHTEIVATNQDKSKNSHVDNTSTHEDKTPPVRDALGQRNGRNPNNPTINRGVSRSTKEGFAHFSSRNPGEVKKQTALAEYQRFVDIYNERKPATWACCDKLNNKRIKGFKKLFDEWKEIEHVEQVWLDAIAFVNADKWWRETCSSRSIDTLLWEGKATTLRDKYQTIKPQTPSQLQTSSNPPLESLLRRVDTELGRLLFETDLTPAQIESISKYVDATEKFNSKSELQMNYVKKMLGL